MSAYDFLLDSVTLSILKELSGGERRYSELKNELNTSDSTLTSRLEKLREHKLIDIVARSSDGGRNYVAYTLTAYGTRVVQIIDVSSLLEKLGELEFA